MALQEKLVLMVADIYSRPKEMEMIIERYITRSGVLRTETLFADIQEASDYFCSQSHIGDHPQKFDIQKAIGKYCYLEKRKLELKGVEDFLNVGMQNNSRVVVNNPTHTYKFSKKWWALILTILIIALVGWFQRKNVDWELISNNKLISGLIVGVVLLIVGKIFK